jgi:hypothetical protein
LYLSLGLTTDLIKDILYCKYPENDAIDQKNAYCEELLQLYEAKLREINKQRRILDDAQLRLEKQIEFMKENRDTWE